MNLDEALPQVVSQVQDTFRIRAFPIAAVSKLKQQHAVVLYTPALSRCGCKRAVRRG